MGLLKKSTNDIFRDILAETIDLFEQQVDVSNRGNTWVLEFSTGESVSITTFETFGVAAKNDLHIKGYLNEFFDEYALCALIEAAVCDYGKIYIMKGYDNE